MKSKIIKIASVTSVIALTGFASPVGLNNSFTQLVGPATRSTIEQIGLSPVNSYGARASATKRRKRDRDRDFLADRDERKIFRTSARLKDSDLDGTPDGDEDRDHDGVLNKDEFEENDRDSDHDGLADENESDYGSDLHDSDSDDDGILDGNEDSDGDGVCDEDEDDDHSNLNDDEHEDEDDQDLEDGDEDDHDISNHKSGHTVLKSFAGRAAVVRKKRCKGKLKKSKKCKAKGKKTTPKPTPTVVGKPAPTAPPSAPPTVKPTSVPTAKPGNFDANGNTTKFGIPAGLTGNISQGSTTWSGYCRSCHGGEKTNKSFSQLKASMTIPEMRNLNMSDQQLAHLVAYLNRNNP